VEDVEVVGQRRLADGQSEPAARALDARGEATDDGHPHRVGERLEDPDDARVEVLAQVRLRLGRGAEVLGGRGVLGCR
jgi:hypothetical protein